MMKGAWLVFCFLGCVAPQQKQAPGVQTISGTGQIMLVDSAAKRYAIYTRDGNRYLPTNLQEEFKQEKLSVVFEAFVDSSKLRNVRLAGIPVVIKRIRVER